MTVSGLTITGEWRPSGHRQDRMIQKILSDIRGDGRDLFRFRTVIEDGPTRSAATVPPSSQPQTAWSAARPLADRLGVRSVVLLPLDVGLDINRRGQPYRMAETADLPAPMMRAATRRHRAARLLGHEVQQLHPAHLLAERNRPVRPRTVQLKAVLRQIDPDDDNLFHGPPVLILASTTPPTWHLEMPSGGATPALTVRSFKFPVPRINVPVLVLNFPVTFCREFTGKTACFQLVTDGHWPEFANFRENSLYFP